MVQLSFNHELNLLIKVDVILNGLEKYMAFTINKSFVFIDSKQSMNSSLKNWLKVYQMMILNT